MLAFVIDIYVVFENHVFQQSVGIIMGTDCAPLLADLFLYAYEAEMFSKTCTRNKITPCDLHSTFRYTNDVLSINNWYFHSYVGSIYHCELEIKDTIEPESSDLCLDILLEKDINGNLT